MVLCCVWLPKTHFTAWCEQLVWTVSGRSLAKHVSAGLVYLVLHSAKIFAVKQTEFYCFCSCNNRSRKVSLS